jgi:hypothetical protein
VPEMNRFASRAHRHGSRPGRLRPEPSIFLDIAAPCALSRQLAIVFSDLPRICAIKPPKALYQELS